MKTPISSLLTIGCIVLGTTGCTPLETGKWWNPLPSQTSSTSTPLINGRPLQSAASSAGSGVQSIAGSMTQGTKQVVGGTFDLLTLKPLRTAMSSPSQSRMQDQAWASAPWTSSASNPTRKSSSRGNSRSSESGGFWSNLFSSREEPELPSTMQEWVAQPRPGLD